MAIGETFPYPECMRKREGFVGMVIEIRITFVFKYGVAYCN